VIALDHLHMHTSQGATVTVSFESESLYGAPLLLDSSVACPPNLYSTACEDFAVQTAGDCIWHSVYRGNVTVALAPGGTQLQLTLLNSTGNIVATRGYFANWPIVSLRGGANSLPAEPWLANITDGVGCAPPPPRLATDFDAVNHA
jgi:hypothetical protein